MERDKPGSEASSGPELEGVPDADGLRATTVTELMDRIERTALERYFANRDSRHQFNWRRPPPTPA